MAPDIDIIMCVYQTWMTLRMDPFQLNAYRETDRQTDRLPVVRPETAVDFLSCKATKTHLAAGSAPDPLGQTLRQTPSARMSSGH